MTVYYAPKNLDTKLRQYISLSQKPSNGLYLSRRLASENCSGTAPDAFWQAFAAVAVLQQKNLRNPEVFLV